MDQLDGNEAISENGDDTEGGSPVKSRVNIDPGDVWGGHLNKEKNPARSKQSTHASPRPASKKRQSHSSIFSKLLASDVSLFVPSVKSARQIAEPGTFSKVESPAKSVVDGKAFTPRGKKGTTSTDIQEPSMSPFFKGQGSSVFSGQRKSSVFMRKLGDSSFSEANSEISTLDFGGIKSPESSQQRSGSWEAFSSDEPDVADSTFEMVKKGDRCSSFGASLLRSGNRELKPRKAVMKVSAAIAVNVDESSPSLVSSLGSECGVERSKSASITTDNEDETFSPSIRGSKPAGRRDMDSESKHGRVEYTKRSGDHDRARFSPPSGSGTDTIKAGVSELSDAWNRRVDEDAASIHYESTTKESVKRSRSETVAEASDDPKPKAKRAKTVGSGGGNSAVSENYVRVNLKKKKYVRGAKTMTGSKYKRQQWKQRMKSRGQGEGGTDKCFKCGGTGHWANKCTGKAKSGAVGVDNEVLALKETMETAESKDDEAFPSLEDAADMARGIKYKTKKSSVTSISIYPETTKKKKKKFVSVTSADAKNNNEAETCAYDFSDCDDDDVSWQVKEDKVTNDVNSSEGRVAMDPVFQMQDGKLPETPAAVWNALKIFGYSSFRPGQEEAVMRVLCGQSTLVILSTGAGKSLCYKLPAYLYGTRKQAITLVISPLVSLMEDQVADLPKGVRGACLHTNMTPGQRQKVAQSVYDNEVHFLLMSPESLVGGGSNSGIVNFSKMPPVAFACIDEAHCLSEWSHHFRPSYLRVCKVLREQLNVTCMLGLTATATMTTAVSVAHHLNIADFKSAFIRGVPVPANLVLSVSKDERRTDALINLLQGDRFKDLNSIIIYCTRRQETEQIATRIRTCLGDKTKPKPKGRAKKYTKVASDEPLDWDAEPYHAGLSAACRKRVQKLFMSGRLKVVVATVAFGMGLDKSDVRSVIHYNLPKTFESYVQEIGRAGRDGQPAHCHLFLDENDLCELKKHTYGNTVDRYVLKKFVKMVFPVCKCRTIEQQCGSGSGSDSEPEAPPQAKAGPRLCHGHQRAVPIDTTTNSLDVREEGIGTLLCYLELHPDRWLENHRPTYATCNIRCYGGQLQLKEVAKSCPPVAAAVAWCVKSGIKPTNQVTFPVVEIADMMGWDAGPVKRELYSLQWTTSGSGSRKSGVLVEFSDLAFHFRSPGDLTGHEQDQVTDFLHDRVQMQERAEIHQLKRLFETLSKIAFRDFSRCCDSVSDEKSQWLRQQLLDYFDEPPTHDPSTITVLSFAREMEVDAQQEEPASQTSSRDNYQLLSDIHSFINAYSSEHTLTGRAIARIFQGIGSPCFPIEVWGKVRRFWRSHLATDFNQIRLTATRELIKFR